MPSETEQPFGAYVHWPFCKAKCPYCDFNSYEARRALPDLEYVAALLRDLRADLAFAQGRTIETVYFGGGTPSLFSSVAIARLLEGVRAEASIAADAEITLEANPGAVDTARFAAFRGAGVNRLSIGVQSFRDDKLRAQLNTVLAQWRKDGTLDDIVDDWITVKRTTIEVKPQ